MFFLGLLIFLAACANATPLTATPQIPTLSPGSTPLALIILRPGQAGQTLTVQKGQILFMANPNPAIEWQIDYASEILEKIPAPEDQKQAEPGWYFRAVGAGATDLSFSGAVKCTQPPCPPAALRFVFTIEVKP